MGFTPHSTPLGSPVTQGTHVYSPVMTGQASYEALAVPFSPANFRQTQFRQVLALTARHLHSDTQ